MQYRAAHPILVRGLSGLLRRLYIPPRAQKLFCASHAYGTTRFAYNTGLVCLVCLYCLLSALADLIIVRLSIRESFRRRCPM